jgi:hypothetical protein
VARYRRYNQTVSIKNGVPAKYLFEERAKYDRLYPKGFGYPEPIDFWLDKNRMYGLFDLKKNMITPNPQFIVQLSEGKNDNLFAFDFVVDAFKDFKRYMTAKNGQKLVEDGERIKKPVDPYKMRDGLDQDIYDAFTNNFLRVGNQHKKIKDIDTFMEVFLNSLMKFVATEIPLTMQGMLLSNITTPMSSGLCVEISKDDKSDVTKIFDTYLNNVNYKSYLMTASKFGFLVDKNVPYRLVANLSSPKMQEYIINRMRPYLDTQLEGKTKLTQKQFVPYDPPIALDVHFHKYEIDEMGNGETQHIDFKGVKHKHKIVNFVVEDAQGWQYPDGVPTGIGPHSHGLPIKDVPTPWSLDLFFKTYYFKTIERDIVFLRTKLQSFYNQYVQKYPRASYAKPCGTEGVRKVTINRIPISAADYGEEYSEVFFLKLYFIVRLKELKADVEEDAIKANIKKIDNLYNLVDSAEAIRYINRYLKQYY